jgi:hypothetical protein
MNIIGNNQVYNYHQHNCLLIFIRINYMATCFDQSLVICRPVCDITIKLQLEIDFTVRPRSHICFHILGYRLKIEKLVARTSSGNLGSPYICPRDTETISVGINWTELRFCGHSLQC